ncbi:MAG: carboxylesterase family protein [Chloroflexi bacterium]|nr:carboxylesterase family protein [Chloroflexota bacterium]
MGTHTTTASASYGILCGVAAGDVVIFRGIPYARTPVRNLPFAPPQPPDPLARHSPSARQDERSR